MSDQPPIGPTVGRLRRKVWLWIYCTALVLILLAILLLMMPRLLARYPLVPDVLATYIFFGVGLLALCLYVCVPWLRHHFPFDWIIAGIIAVLLTLGTVSVLSEQEATHVLILSVEILMMMALLLLYGSWQLFNMPKEAQLFLGWYVFAVVGSLVMVLTCNSLADTFVAIEVASHFVFWQVAFPLIVFQAQVISGHWDNVPTLLDKPLCSTMLLLDFLVCYVFLDSTDAIGPTFYYVGHPETHEFFRRLSDNPNFEFGPQR